VGCAGSRVVRGWGRKVVDRVAGCLRAERGVAGAAVCRASWLSGGEASYTSTVARVWATIEETHLRGDSGGERIAVEVETMHNVGKQAVLGR